MWEQSEKMAAHGPHVSAPTMATSGTNTQKGAPPLDPPREGPHVRRQGQIGAHRHELPSLPPARQPVAHGTEEQQAR